MSGRNCVMVELWLMPRERRLARARVMLFPSANVRDTIDYLENVVPLLLSKTCCLSLTFAMIGCGADGGAVANATGGAGSSDTGGRTSNGATGGVTSGGVKATGGATSSPDTGVDCSATLPSDGTKHTGNSRGGSGNLAWELWANNGNNGSITTFSTPAFAASWSNAGDFLARLGYEWGNSGRKYDSFGQISAQFSWKKSGDAGGYSYLGIYGWSTDPCVEYYIVDDAFKGLPFNPGNTTDKGTVNIDGSDYVIYLRNTTGTGGSRCSSSITNWNQYYSIRKTARQCGTISVTKHFDAWKAAGLQLGNMLEAKIVIEAGGGTGSVEVPVAKMTAQ